MNLYKRIEKCPEKYIELMKDIVENSRNETDGFHGEYENGANHALNIVIAHFVPREIKKENEKTHCY